MMSEHDELLARLEYLGNHNDLLWEQQSWCIQAAAAIRSLQEQPNDCVEGVLRADTEAIWQQVISACALAWPEQEKLFYSASPTELIERIIAERDAERKARERVETLHKGLMQEVEKRAESSERRLAEVEQDARRYRFLRDSKNYPSDDWWSFNVENLECEELDAAIDAAVKESAEQEQDE